MNSKTVLLKIESNSMSTRKVEILCLNPNTSEIFTSKIKKCVDIFLKQKNLDKHINITCINPKAGPITIESMYDEILSCQSGLQYILKNKNKFDGIIIGCFSDHPLIACCREILSIPVVGIMDSSLYSACFIGHKFSIINTNKQWETLLFDGVQRLGLLNKCASIKSCNLPPLSLADNDMEKVMENEIIKQSEIAVEKDGADVIVLGCAGMVGLGERFKDNDILAKVTIVDPIIAGVMTCYSLIQQDLKTSKHNLYSYPEDKEIKGMDSIFYKGYQKSKL